MEVGLTISLMDFLIFSPYDKGVLPNQTQVQGGRISQRGKDAKLIFPHVAVICLQ